MQQQYFRQLVKIVPNVSHETFSDLCIYETQLRRWQTHINLVANSTLENIWQRHILDSAQLFPLQKEAKIWLDCGSGAGFPALVSACFLKQQNIESKQEKRHIYLIESNSKKTAFLRHIIQTLSLPATVYQNRIEDIIDSVPVPDVITARALASLEKLFIFFAPLFLKRKPKQNITALLQKGRNFMREVEQAQREWNFDMEIKPAVTESDSVILLIRNLQKR